MADGHASQVAETLGQLQDELRKALLDDLASEGEELSDALDPQSYSYKMDTLRDTYIDKLYGLQVMINELAKLDQNYKGQVKRVLSVAAQSHERLTRIVNQKLAQLGSCQVTDIKFVPAPNGQWVAFIIFVPSPFGDE